MNRKLLIIVLAGIALLAIPALILAQGTALPPGEYDLEAGQYVLNVPALVSTSTPVPPTDTPVPPTDTPMPPTDTPIPPTEHNKTEWHPVSADISHTHNADPDSVAHIFGPILDYLPQSISYPWQTTNENLNKHEGYKWGVAEHSICIQRAVYVGRNCVMAWRIEHHQVGGSVGAVTRFHSGYAELLICDFHDLQDCGILRIGQPLVDYGCLRSNRPIVREHIPLPSDGNCADRVVDGLYKGAPYREHTALENGSPVGVNWTVITFLETRIRRDASIETGRIQGGHYVRGAQ